MKKNLVAFFIALATSTVVETSVATAPITPVSVSNTTVYRTVRVDNLNLFYREAGPRDAPTIVLLHGFPSSSRMFEPLFTRLAGRFHLIALDYPGFGHSDAPSPSTFEYTFDRLAAVTNDFIQRLGLERYVLYVQDYGGPIGFRMAQAHPEKVQGLIIQNAVAHEDGLGSLWDKRRAFWADRKANEAALQSGLLSLQSARARHVGTSPYPEKFDPDLWTDEYLFLNQPGQREIQTDLFYDYRTNVSSYPRWQAWLKEHQPKTLIVWGRYDSSFEVEEAAAYKRELPQAEVHVIDAGHFALDEKPDEIAGLIVDFMRRADID